MSQLRKVKKSTLHLVCELVDGIYNDWVRGFSVDEEARSRMIEEGRKRVDEVDLLLFDYPKGCTQLIDDNK